MHGRSIFHDRDKTKRCQQGVLFGAIPNKLRESFSDQKS